LGGAGQLGEEEQTGSVYKQPEREVTIPVTTGGSQVSGVRVQRGANMEPWGSKGKCAMYICKRDVCVRVIEPLE
jgi:hypothetical protein